VWVHLKSGAALPYNAGQFKARVQALKGDARTQRAKNAFKFLHTPVDARVQVLFCVTFLSLCVINPPDMTPVALVHSLERKQLAHKAPVDAQAQLVDMWLYQKAENSKEAYRRIVANFLAFVAKPIPQVTLEDLYQYAGHLEGLKLSLNSQKTYLSIIKSLLSFATKIGMTQVNAGAALTLKSPPDSLSKRILSETEIILLTHAEKDPRNRMILRLFYASGIRVSELAHLKWQDLTPRGDSGQIEVFGGKGGKSRSVLIAKVIWDELVQLRGNAREHEAVFKSHSRKHGGHLSRKSIDRIVKAAGVKAGLTKKISSHTLRHCHASHSLERGASVALVSETLGHADVKITSRYLHARPGDSSGLYLTL